ncbi:zinc finger, UBP-type [Anaeromyxobacter sp. K]|uniref:ubiquitin carboxyl-terminal hydrolase 14 n=1 Tax=Anaeromyxobacter sp. (strain K) TaxID=447217 RepID=UPI00015F9B23|nr:UBP-type zinc finger domain-containing protein [Anaeromyxobacter sp. K]ACG72278.1 zinc finger, UBP-type [Anaeromyxobacter sp. K]
MCEHLETVERRRAAVRPRTQGCEECLASGDRWVQLRLCLTCGHVGCCDSSPNRHATRHFHETDHPVVRSFEPGADWAWCYVDEEMAHGVRGFPAESPGEHA